MNRINCLHIDPTQNTCNHPNYASYTLGFSKDCIYKSNPGFACTNGCKGYTENTIPKATHGLPAVKQIPPMPPVKPPKVDDKITDAKLADWEKAREFLLTKGIDNGYYHSPDMVLPGLVTCMLAYARQEVITEISNEKKDYGYALKLLKKGKKVRARTMEFGAYIFLRRLELSEYTLVYCSNGHEVNASYVVPLSRQLSEEWEEVID